MKSIETLSAPVKPAFLPESIQWLAGEGAGSWFHIEQKKQGYFISRYSPYGILECRSNFVNVTNIKFNINEPFYFFHLSHCSEVKYFSEW